MKKRILIVALIAALMISALPMVGLGATTDNTNQLKISLPQAYDMALKISTTLKQDDITIQQSEESKKMKDLRVSFTPLSASSPAADAAYTSAVAASISSQMAGRTKTVDQDKLYVDVVTKYTDLLLAEEDYNYNQKALKYAESKWKADSLSYALGLSSLIQRDQAEASYKAAKSSYQVSQLTLEKAYRNLNYLLGLNEKTRPVLTEKPGYSVYEVANVENEISRVMDQHPTLWNLQQRVNLARISSNLVDISTTSVKSAMLDVDNAQLTANNTATQTANGLRNLYNAIKQLEESYVVQDQQLKIYQETAKTKKLMYELGMATKNDYDSAQVDVLKAQKSLNSIIYQHEILEIDFQKPWAYTASM